MKSTAFAPIAFALTHPAWYQLLWCEQIPAHPPRRLLQIRSAPGRLFRNAAARSSTREISEEQAAYIGSIIHSFLHGSLSQIAAHRIQDDPSQVKEDRAAKTQHLSALVPVDWGDSHG